jgi:hypothetical protein
VADGRDDAPQSESEEEKDLAEGYGDDPFATVPEMVRPSAGDSVEGEDGFRPDNDSVIANEDPFGTTVRTLPPDEDHPTFSNAMPRAQADPSTAAVRNSEFGQAAREAARQLAQRPGEPGPTRQRTIKGATGGSVTAVSAAPVGRFGMYATGQ